MLSPGGTIGILGAGQLGRMLAVAAARLGFRCHIFADEHGPACDVAAAASIARYDDVAALDAFARAVDVATFEFENVPVLAIETVGRCVPVRPGVKALACAQDRLSEKRLARDLGAMTADFAGVDSLDELRSRVAQIGLPAVLKTRRMGYDGKGQAKIRAPADIEAAYAHMKAQPAILESFLVFDREVSVIGARAVDGTFRAYDVTDNEHRGHILHRSLAPAPIPAATADEAIAITRRMADALDYVGVLAVEFFVLPRGQLVVNEIAPRVHNSGHWTLGGAQTSQFEQHIRAVAGWPLGDTTRRGAAVEMINLIGDEIARWPEIVAEPGTALHHYGKRETRPGRKMGHVTRILARYPTLGGMDSG